MGAYEAQSIALAMEYMETPRPLTHDLIGSIIKKIESDLKSVKITNLADGVFYARMDIEGDLVGERSIDARPSDAIAVALRMHAPILVDEKVMDEAGIEDIGSGEEDAAVEPLMQHSSRKKLEEKLQKAVDMEDYEQAAIIRDKIRDMETG